MQKSAQSTTPSYPPTSSLYQQDPYPSPSPKTEYTAHGTSPLAPANSRSCKPRNHSHSSQTLPHPKKGASDFSTPKAFPSTPVEDSKLAAEEVKPPPKARNPAKVSHSITERRYRHKLSSTIVQLEQLLSSTRILKDRAQDPEAHDEEYPETPVKARKADVLNEAMRYIKQAEHDGEARDKEIDSLKRRLAALERIVNSADCVLLQQFADQQMHFPTNFAS